jgi:uncharacterized membrane protein
VNGDGGMLDPGVPTDAARSPDIERIVARLLTVGTYSSVAVLAVGTAMMLASGVKPLAGWPPFDLGQIGDDLVHLRPLGFLWLGLIAVVATPASRVAASLIGYLRTGERLMALIAVLILAVIALSVALARGLGA